MMKTQSKNKPNTHQLSIFDYWSTQELLIGWVDEEKSRNAKFSYQYLANKLGLKSKSSIANFLAGRRKITIEILVPLSKTLRLNNKETNYLEALILFETVEDDTQKHYYRDQLLNLKPAEQAYNLERSYTQFLEKWYTQHALRYLLLY